MSERVYARVSLADVVSKTKSEVEDIIRRAIEKEPGDPGRAARRAVDDLRRSSTKVNVHGRT